MISITKESVLAGQIMPFDKPYGWTSFDLVKKVRYALSKRTGIRKLKIGHAGTLDPLATGLVILCTGKATKRIQSIQDMPKEYIAEIKLGATTPSFDLETGIDHTYPVNHITSELIEQSLKNFLGEIQQVPPLFSAKNVNGERAYNLARKGISMELKPSQVEIFNMEIVENKFPVIILKITCSKGTYIRSLARDIGLSLNSGAHLTALRRTRIGNYKENAVFDIKKLQKTLGVL